MMENNEGLVKRLKFLRKEKGVTQKQLADSLGVSLPAIVNYENAQRTPSSAVLTLLSQYFNVSKEYLLGESDDRTPAYKWEEPEIVLAVGDNLSTLFDTVERAVREVSDEEQKLVFAGGASPHVKAERQRPAPGSSPAASRYGSRCVTLAGEKPIRRCGSGITSYFFAF